MRRPGKRRLLGPGPMLRDRIKGQDKGLGGVDIR